jgi:hypothetical protein
VVDPIAARPAVALVEIRRHRGGTPDHLVGEALQGSRYPPDEGDGDRSRIEGGSVDGEVFGEARVVHGHLRVVHGRSDTSTGRPMSREVGRAGALDLGGPVDYLLPVNDSGVIMPAGRGGGVGDQPTRTANSHQGQPTAIRSSNQERRPGAASSEQRAGTAIRDSKQRQGAAAVISVRTRARRRNRLRTPPPVADCWLLVAAADRCSLFADC